MASDWSGLGAPWTYPMAGRVEETVIDSQALTGNPLGDPHRRPLLVQLPPTYDAEPERRFPTIYVLQWTGLFKTILGLVLVEVALILPFAVLIFRTFMSAIPRELDEAAIIDGATPWTLFSKVIFPLLRPAVITVIVVASVTVYNDFVNPLYFLPGTANATVQLTLFDFQSQFSTRWNLLFTDVLLITIPPLILFTFFQRQIVSGMTAGAVKG